MWSKKYIVEARIWSSIRAQKLSRTINGIIYYKKVLRLLANLKQVNNDTTYDPLSEKVGSIVSSQEYEEESRFKSE